MEKLVDARGDEAIVGKTVGYWLNETDFVSTTDNSASQLKSLGFPRDWPNVYSTSKPLKSLIGKKGRCAGKKVGVVGLPLPEESEQASGCNLYRLQSFANAEKIQRATGFQIIHGWAVFEHWDLAVSAAFVAERYWWNALPDGKWVDFTPRPDNWPELLLAEAAGDATKEQAKLTSEDAAIASVLFQQRFSVALLPVSESGAPGKAAATKAETTTTREVSDAPVSLRSLTKRVQAGEVEAVRELEEKLNGDEAMCIRVAGSEVLVSLAGMLAADASQEDALKLLLLLTDAAVSQKDRKVGSEVISAGAVPQLVKLLAGNAPNLQEVSAAVLGNICHESPPNQERVAAAGVLKPLVKLLSADAGPAQEAAYAIWNLTVGHEQNSAAVVRLGAVPGLTKLLNSDSDIAQENAAGALMHVTMSQEARSAIVEAGAIGRLCELLKPSYEPEVSSQAAGALLNLASDCPEYGKMIVSAGAIVSLVNLAKDGPDLAKEYAAGAVMNLIRGELEVAAQAAKAGAIPVLAALLSRQTGQSEALGALANLASSSSERQIAVYKAQVTRKSVALLGDPDVDVRRSAAAVLMNISPHAKIKERVVEAGALKPLAVCLKDDDAAVKERAAGALANLFNDHSANVHAGFSQAPDMIPALVAMLQSGAAVSDDAKRQAAHALAMLAAEDGPCDAVWSAGAGPPLLALLKDMIAEAALGIMNLSWRWPEVKKELAKGGTIEYLKQMLGTGEAMAKEYAAGALMNMTAGSPENAEQAVDVVAPLVALLKAEGLQAAEWSAGALANIVRVNEGTQKKAVDAGAVPALTELLPKVSANGRTLVVLALTSLAEGQAAAVREALSSQKLKAKLRDFRGGDNEELRDYTNALVDKLGSGFTL